MSKVSKSVKQRVGLLCNDLAKSDNKISTERNYFNIASKQSAIVSWFYSAFSNVLNKYFIFIAATLRSNVWP